VPHAVPDSPDLMIFDFDSSSTSSPAASKRASRTTLKSPNHMPSSSAAKRPQSASPGHVRGTPVNQKNADKDLRTPSVTASSASPGREVTVSATKRRQSASRLPHTTPDSSDLLVFNFESGSSQTSPPAASKRVSHSRLGKSDTTASPSHVQSSLATERPHSASPGRVPKPPGNKNSSEASSKTPSTMKSALASPGCAATGRVQSASPGRVPKTPSAEKGSEASSKTPSTMKGGAASPGRAVTGLATKRLQSASPGRVQRTPGTEKSSVTSSKTPSTMKGASASPHRAVTGSVTKRPQSASPGRVPKTPGTDKSSEGSFKTPSTMKSASGSPGRVVTGRVQSASTGRVPKTPGTEKSSETSSKTPSTMKGALASPSRVVTGSATKRPQSASPGRVLKTPNAEKSSERSSKTSSTMKGALGSPGRAMTGRVQSASPGRVPKIPRIEKSSEASSKTPSTMKGALASPGRAVTGRVQSASPGRVPGSHVKQTVTVKASATAADNPSLLVSSSVQVQVSLADAQDSASPQAAVKSAKTPRTKPLVSGSPSQDMTDPVVKRRKSASSGRVPVTPLTGGNDDSLTPVNKPRNSLSPRHVVSSSAKKRQKSASPGCVTGTPVSEISVSSEASSKPHKHRSRSSGRRRGSSGLSTPLTHDGEDGAAGTPVISPAAVTSPSLQRSALLTERRDSSSAIHVTSSPSTPKSSARRRVSRTRKSTPAKPSGSAAKHRDIASPSRMSDSTPLSEKARSRRATRTPVNKPALSASPGKQDSGSPEPQTGSVPVSASPRQKHYSVTKRKSFSPGLLATTPVTETDSSASPRQQLSVSAASRPSASPVVTTGSLVRNSPKLSRSGVLSSEKRSAKRGVKRSGGPLEEPPRKQLGVSFGPDMSPEVFDQRLPPITPIKRGATPRRISKAESVLKPLLKGRHSAVGSTVSEDIEHAAVSVASAKAAKFTKRYSLSTEHSGVTLEANTKVTADSAVKGKRSGSRMSVAEEPRYVMVSADSPQSVKSAKRRSKSVERSVDAVEQSMEQVTPVAQKPVLKGRVSSAVRSEAEGVEVSLGTPKAAKRQSQSAEEHFSETVQFSGKIKPVKSTKKRSKSLTIVDDLEVEPERVTEKDMSVNRSKSAAKVKEVVVAGGPKYPVKVTDRPVAASPDRLKKTPRTAFHYRSPTLETGSVKVKGSKKIALTSPKRARSVSPLNAAAGGDSQLIAVSPVTTKRAPHMLFHYRSPTLETGSVKVKGSKKIDLTSPKRARSVSPLNAVARGRGQPVAVPPVLAKRTPQKPLRYRSPTLETGSVEIKGSTKTASPAAKRARSLSVERPAVVTTSTSKTDGRLPATLSSHSSRIATKGKLTAVDMESSPTSYKRSRSPLVLHSTPAVVTDVLPATLPERMQKSVAVTPPQKSSLVVTPPRGTTTPVSVKKRKSLTASGQKGKTSPNVYSVSPSSVKKASSSRLDSSKTSSSPGSHKRLKTVSSESSLSQDSVETSSESTASSSVITPGRMVAMRAVFGREMTPKLKLPGGMSPSGFSQKTASSARKSEKAAAKLVSTPKTATRRSAAKVKSSGKSTKVLWSEVVRRAAKTRKSGAKPVMMKARKSGPKILKPVVGKARKVQDTVKPVVCIAFCCCLFRLTYCLGL